MRAALIPSVAVLAFLCACQATASTQPDGPGTPSYAATASTYPAAARGPQVGHLSWRPGRRSVSLARKMLDSADTRAWIDAENRVTSNRLAQIPGRDRIKQRLTELWNYERYGSPEQYGGKYFYTHAIDGPQNQAVLYGRRFARRDTARAARSEHAVEGRHRRAEGLHDPR